MVDVAPDRRPPSGVRRAVRVRRPTRPSGRSRCSVSGDEYRADSLPLIEWLEEQVVRPPLLPADPGERARVRARTAWIDDSRLSAPMLGVYYGTATRPHRPGVRRPGRRTRRDGRRLGTGHWLAGVRADLAEAAVVPLYVGGGAGAPRLHRTRRPPGRPPRGTVLRGLERVAVPSRGPGAQTDELVGPVPAVPGKRRRTGHGGLIAGLRWTCSWSWTRSRRATRPATRRSGWWPPSTERGHRRAGAARRPTWCWNTGRWAPWCAR